MPETRKLVVIGATGGCADLIDLARDVHDAGQPWEVVGVLDDRAELHGRVVFGAQVLGGTDLVPKLPEARFITAIGNSRNFRDKPEVLARWRVPAERWATLVHPTSVVSRYARVGAGDALFPHTVVGPNAVLGDQIQLLPGTVVGHDTRIGDHTIVNASCALAGNVEVGPNCYLGARTAVRQDVRVGAGTLVGMGSVVVRDLPGGCTAYGVPARVREG